MGQALLTVMLSLSSPYLLFASQLLGHQERAASKLIGPQETAGSHLIGQPAASSPLIGGKAVVADSQLTGLSAEAGYRSARLNWRLEQSKEKGENFRIRYCENQVKRYIT